MPRYLILLVLFFISLLDSVFAHQDFSVIKNYDNVKVRITTGFRYEEIYKSLIIGELALKLCKELNYTKPVFLDFNHAYTSDCEPDYFISYDNGTIIHTWDDKPQKSFLKKKSLVIREVSRQFNPEITLKLLEYAINKMNTIPSQQDEIIYEQNYRQWKINSIDTTVVKTATASL